MCDCVENELCSSCFVEDATSLNRCFILFGAEQIMEEIKGEDVRTCSVCEYIYYLPHDCARLALSGLIYST